METLKIKYKQCITIEHISDWEYSQDMLNQYNTSICSYVREFTQLFNNYQNKLNILINMKDDQTKEICTEYLNILKNEQQTCTYLKEPISYGYKVYCVISRHSKQIPTNDEQISHSTLYLIINDQSNTKKLYKWKPVDNYSKTVLLNEKNYDKTTTEFKIESRKTTDFYRFRLDKKPLCTYLGANLKENNKTIKYHNNTPDLIANTLIEEVKQSEPIIEEIKQQLEECKYIEQIEDVDNKTYKTYKNINDLPIDKNIHYTVTDIKKTVVVKIDTYAIQIDNGDYFKINKFMKDIINTFLNNDAKKIPHFKFSIEEKAYYPGDKKGKLNVIKLQ